MLIAENLIQLFNKNYILPLHTVLVEFNFTKWRENEKNDRWHICKTYHKGHAIHIWYKIIYLASVLDD